MIWREKLMQNKTPFVNSAKLREIAEKFPTPFHLYDERGIRSTARELQRAFSWNGSFREYYAVNACPNPFILDILKEEGCGVDCSSLTELLLAEACGFRGDMIMFSSNETPPEEFEKARELGAVINLDDITHIELLQKHGGIPDHVCLRYNPGGTLRIGETCMGHPEEAKYGMTHEQIFIAVQRLKDLGVTSFSFHCFLASNVLDDSYYPENARILFQLAAEAHEKLGVDIRMINLSGGIGIPYRPEESPVDIMHIGSCIEKYFHQILVSAGLGNTSIATELGRYMTGPHGCLVTRATHRKKIYREYIGVDASAADLLRPAMYGAYHHITVSGKETAPYDRIYDIVGSLCENNDKFAVQRALPEIEMGDLLIIHDTGAHGHSMGYNYNGRLRSAEILLHEDGSFGMIRRAETIRDYFATFDFCDYYSRLVP